MSKLSIVIYSDDSTVRQSLQKALGVRLSPEFPENEIHEFATADALRLFAVESNRENRKKISLFILDGEATPEGGLGLAKQLKDELFNCPPTIVVVARSQDAWLAGWSRADGVITHPIDPFTIGKTVISVLSKNRSLAKVENSN
ncbi:MAG TPA: response regulator [Candidatus Nanopelagicaceae bacterium]